MRLADLRRVTCGGSTGGGRYLIWLTDGRETLEAVHLEGVWIRPDARWANRPVVWPEHDPILDEVVRGDPPSGDYVSADRVGMDQVSPGYAAASAKE